MKRCKHRVSDIVVTAAPGAEFDSAIRVRCADCLDYLPIGPAADDKPEVQIEIRAAEIAARLNEEPPVRWSHVLVDGAEIAGWIIAVYDSAKTPEQPGERAGYLARLIYEHKEEA